MKSLDGGKNVFLFLSFTCKTMAIDTVKGIFVIRLKTQKAMHKW